MQKRVGVKAPLSEGPLVLALPLRSRPPKQTLQGPTLCSHLGLETWAQSKHPQIQDPFWLQVLALRTRARAPLSSLEEDSTRPSVTPKWRNRVGHRVGTLQDPVTSQGRAPCLPPHRTGQAQGVPMSVGRSSPSPSPEGGRVQEAGRSLGSPGARFGGAHTDPPG